VEYLRAAMNAAADAIARGLSAPAAPHPGFRAVLRAFRRRGHPADDRRGAVAAGRAEEVENQGQTTIIEF
jgi:hypothetical protein